MPVIASRAHLEAVVIARAGLVPADALFLFRHIDAERLSGAAYALLIQCCDDSLETLRAATAAQDDLLGRAELLTVRELVHFDALELMAAVNTLPAAPKRTEAWERDLALVPDE